jgi:hypothetical protein
MHGPWSKSWGTGLDPDIAFKERKNLIPSKSSPCSLEGPIRVSFYRGCRMKVLKGLILIIA